MDVQDTLQHQWLSNYGVTNQAGKCAMELKLNVHSTFMLKISYVLPLMTVTQIMCVQNGDDLT